MNNWILVVDDDAANLRMASSILSAEKMRVSCLKSGEDAITFLQENRPDLILLDIHMPGMNGFETIETIKRNEKTADIPVIFLSADDDNSAETRGLEIGAKDFIKKPFVPDVLLLRVRNTIELVRLQANLEREVEIKTQDEHLYKEVVTNMREGVMVISMNGKITMLNPAAEDMLDLTQNDVGEAYGNIFLMREGTDAFNEVIFNTIYEKGKVDNKAVDYLCNGEVRNLSLTTSYIHSKGEKSVVVVMSDMTELNELRDAQTALEKIKKLNVEYEKAKNEAIMANEAKSLFLSNMSHEIRTPINAVLGMNEMILRECTDEQLLTYADNIRSSGKTLLFLINDILDMSKIESGKMEIVRVDYEPAALIMDLWNVIFLRAQQKDLSIKFSLDETLPKMIHGDDVRIKQIVTNLLTNAVKYTPQGGIEMHVAYERHGDEHISLIISVKDTGMGIKKEDMGKLFESFQRLDEEKNRNIEGTGLGMNITMSLLKLMDGDMKVESEYGKGSTFTVTIPQRIVIDEPTGDFESIKTSQEQNRALSGQHFEAPDANILVVDDNAMNLTVFKSLLKRTKMNIVTADSGMKCLELVKKEHFHIIFMDHMMPEMDGIETLHEIQKLSDFPNEGTPVIVLTANALSGAREGYMKEGFADFLTKPIDGDLLERTVANFLPEELIKAKEDGVQDTETDTAYIDYEGYLQYGISIENGLSLAKGDMDIYLDLIEMFMRDHEKQHDAMQEFIEQNNMKDYAIWVHGLKGNARTLGADKLADMAYEHEMKSKSDDAEYVETHWDELVDLWEETHEGFQEFYGGYRGNDDKYAMVSSDNGEVLHLTNDDLDKVASLLDDFATQQALEQLKEWISQPLEQDMHARIKDVLIALEDEFDEDKAIELLRKA
ncbi:MAG: response regulator [Lachnospiraceae bacterium]|nr:response regulator [Lachnospiraceae bacterium]